MVERSSNHRVEFITCKSLQQQQSMKRQLALQHIPNNSSEPGTPNIISGLNTTVNPICPAHSCFFILTFLFIACGGGRGNPLYANKAKMVSFPVRWSRCCWGNEFDQLLPELS